MARGTTPPLQVASSNSRPPPPPPQASLSGLLFPGQDSRRHTGYHPPGFPTCGLAGSSEEEGRELVGCLNWARSCANMAPRPGVSPGMCPELQAPRLHSLRCSRQSRLQVQAGGIEETWPGEWRVPRQSPSFKTPAGRILPTLQSFGAVSFSCSVQRDLEKACPV